jgi:O-antigen ligase
MTATISFRSLDDLLPRARVLPQRVSRSRRRAERTRGAIACSLIVGALTYASVSQGAFYAREQRIAVVPLVFALFLVARRPDRRDITPPVVGAIALGVWYVIDAVVHGAIGAATPAVLLCVSLASIVAAVRRLDDVEQRLLITGVLLTGVVVALSGVWGVASHHAPQALVDGGLWRAASTVTYANATAALLAMLALLALAWLASVPRSPTRSLLAFVLVTGLIATASRGGLLAFAIGGTVLACALGRRVLRVVPAVGGGVIAALALAPSMPQAGAARPGLAVLGLIAGGLVAVCGARSGRMLLPLAAALAIAAALSPGMSKGIDDVRGSRLSLASADRAHETSAALRVAGHHPLTGVGPGRYLLTWRAGGLEESVAYAHDEYLQVWGESGALGFAIVLGGLIATASAIWSARRRVELWVWAGAVAALAAFSVHSAFDFLWHIPVVPLTGAVLVGLALGRCRPQSSEQRLRRRRGSCHA